MELPKVGWRARLFDDLRRLSKVFFGHAQKNVGVAALIAALRFYMLNGFQSSKLRFSKPLGVVCLSILYAFVSTSCSRGFEIGTASNKVSEGEPKTVAAIGDTPAELRQFITDAQTYGKTPQFVDVTTKNGSYQFSPYAQVARTSKALIVRGFSRVYVWNLTNASVTFSGNAPQKYATNALPVVVAGRIDRIVDDVTNGTGPWAHRKMSPLGLSICPDCAVLFGKPTNNDHLDLWAGIVDPWQKNPNYAYWHDATLAQKHVNLLKAGGRRNESACSNSRNGFYGNYGTVGNPNPCAYYYSGYSYSYSYSSGGNSSGGNGDGEVQYANAPEDPDSQDGPGHGPQPNLSVAQDDACPSSYILAFTAGSGSYGGGAYCQVDYGATDSFQYAQFFKVDQYDNIYFNDQHFWNRHLACYLHNSFTRIGFEQQVLEPDFSSQPIKPNASAPGPKEFTVKVREDNGALSAVSYRVFFRGTITNGGVQFNNFNVSTAFFNPRRPECPRPYPNYQ